MTAPIVFTWMDSTGGEHKAKGSTQNISKSGAYVSCDRPSCPPLGTVGILEVKLPLRQKRSLQLRAGGLVIRVEEILGYPAFAVVADFQLSEDDHKHRAAKQ